MHKLIWSTIFIVTFFAVSNSAFATSDISAEMRLASSRQWLNILHLKRTLLGNYLSRINANSPFFISPDGAQNPLQELQATIGAFKNPDAFLQKNMGHPQCLFPARLKLIKKHLGLDFSKINCTGLEKWKAQIQADHIFILYASQFISNPASVMGHTFIKFHSQATTDYLNIAIGYAANVPEDAGPFEYAYKGLFGGFKGVFSQYPFYEKIHEYNYMERRDLWEYRLALTAEQKDLFLDHFWELTFAAHFNYYFIDENCSYMLLSMIQAIIPDLNLVADTGLYVAPIETIKILRDKGLIDQERFLPSIRKRLLAQYYQLSNQQKKSFHHILEKKILDVSNDALLLDTLLEYFELQKQLNKGVIPSQFTALRQQVLLNRALDDSMKHDTVEQPKSPLSGHGIVNLEGTWGSDSTLKDFFGFNLRPGAHTLSDRDVGYLRNSEFNFFQLNFKHLRESNKTKLTDIQLVSVANLPDFDLLDPQISWAFATALNFDTSTRLSLAPALGLNFSLGSKVHFNIMQDNQLHYHFDQQSRPFTLAPGALARLIFNYHDKMKLILGNKIFHHFFQHNDDNFAQTFFQARLYNIFPQINLGIDNNITHNISAHSTSSRHELKVIYDF